ncbi:hypothetical protein BDV41DRAFT_525232 [Aspergillus transmontanensis]|uniref:Uncharacterized protein n=1 Tax=Aspergillus transmontanensis TaxID=1034304 RepID=A0A5N6WAB8_9EURO|nr:hypothetical protein BDV41DRAFT_525232 [Aspergillus transmontanensis]
MTGLSTNDILLSSGVVGILCTLIRSRAFANRIRMVERRPITLDKKSPMNGPITKRPNRYFNAGNAHEDV